MAVKSVLSNHRAKMGGGGGDGSPPSKKKPFWPIMLHIWSFGRPLEERKRQGDRPPPPPTGQGFDRSIDRSTFSIGIDHPGRTPDVKGRPNWIPTMWQHLIIKRPPPVGRVKAKKKAKKKKMQADTYDHVVSALPWRPFCAFFVHSIPCIRTPPTPQTHTRAVGHPPQSGLSHRPEGEGNPPQAVLSSLSVDQNSSSHAVGTCALALVPNEGLRSTSKRPMKLAAPSPAGSH
jgi:hypothetical protein